LKKKASVPFLDWKWEFDPVSTQETELVEQEINLDENSDDLDSEDSMLVGDDDIFHTDREEDSEEGDKPPNWQNLEDKWASTWLQKFYLLG